MVDVGAGWAAYERAQRKASSSLLQSTARKRRKLERDHGPVSLVFHEPNHALLDQLLKWKSDQYRRAGWRDGFADAGVRQLVHDLMDVQDPAFGGPLTVLRAGEEVVGAHIGLRSPTTLAWWIPAYEPGFGGYSPGLILCLELIRAMTDQGLTSLDLGKGDEHYKRRFANAEIPLLRGSVSHDQLTARLDSARRWPQEWATRFVLESPRVRGWVRGGLAHVGTARTRWAELPERVGAVGARFRSLRSQARSDSQ